MNDAGAQIANKVHSYPIRVFYEDTDAAAVVYYANYLKFAERARTEFLRGLGFDHARVLDEHGIVFAVRRCSADYARPAHLDDALEVQTSVAELGGASFRMQQNVLRDGEHLVSMDLLLVCMTEAGKAARIPDPIRAVMADYLIETS